MKVKLSDWLWAVGLAITVVATILAIERTIECAKAEHRAYTISNLAHIYSMKLYDCDMDEQAERRRRVQIVEATK